MSLKSRGWYVHCDARNCDSQFDAGDQVTEPDDAIMASIEAGWTETVTTVKGAKEALHYCPKVHRIVRTRIAKTQSEQTLPDPSSEPVE